MNLLAKIVFVIASVVLLFTDAIGQKKVTTISCGTCGLNAIYLPKPTYPAAAKAVGLNGKVVVKVLIDENGSVISASVAPGHIFFHRASLKAAYEAKFKPLLLSGKPVRVNTTIIYNFVKPEQTFQDEKAADELTSSGSIKAIQCYKCTDIVVKLPTVEYPASVGYGAHTYEGDVNIQIVIDESGNVESAKGISGHPLFSPMLEKASMTAKFKPTIIDGKGKKLKAIIVYKISPPKFEDEATKSELKLAIINGRAIDLSKPEYSQQAKDLYASGQVKIEVEVSEEGKVLKAIPFSGDEVLFDVARTAAQAATFRPLPNPSVRSNGIVVYNFVPGRKCVNAGNVYGKWLKTPQFSIHPYSIFEEELEVVIRIGIDALSGKVIAAKAIGVHPLNSKTFETEAMKLTFHPSFINSPPIIAKGFIKLRIKADRTVEVVR